MFWPGLEEKKSDKDSTTGSSEDISLKQDSTLNSTTSGLLVAETYSWKNTSIGQPILQIQTTGSHAVCLLLPPGRHILRFVLNFPLGYNLKICSTTPFIFGDEETVLASLQQESLQFVAVADQILTKLGNCIECFGNTETWKKSSCELHDAHMPYTADKSHSKEQNYEIWMEALYAIMESLIGDSYEKHNLLFAIKCLNLWISQSSHDKTEGLGLDQHVKREVSAATCIQKHWRGMNARKIYHTHTNTLSEEHASVIKILTAFWSSLQSNRKANSCNILRNLLTKYPVLINYFSFQNDEWNKLSFTDYQGTFNEQAPRTWFILLREVFHVKDEILCLPKLYHAVPTCNLHVIDNDTGNTIPEVFQKVVPYRYKTNKKGYTLVAEARTLESVLMPGKWKLRMIGSTDSLPTSVENFNSLLHVKEIRDYYIPKDDCIIFRYLLVFIPFVANTVGVVFLC
uniref:Androglobin n=1 Tax=Phallusia mammillata TaxID=59560 RepID=A0A6F9D5C0_9ASCI|nr:androglobin [Phallusia mammillata]